MNEDLSVPFRVLYSPLCYILPPWFESVAIDFFTLTMNQSHRVLTPELVMQQHQGHHGIEGGTLGASHGIKSQNSDRLKNYEKRKKLGLFFSCSSW